MSNTAAQHHDENDDKSNDADADLPRGPGSLLETVRLEHVPATHSVHVAVFRDVENADFLHRQLLDRNAAFEYALIDAASVVSRLHVLSAVFKAITVSLGGALRTPNVHSEIVCSLSPANNISEAYRRYGITPASRHIVAIKVLVSSSSSSDETPEANNNNDNDPSPSTASPSRAADEIERHLQSHVRGRPCPFSDAALARCTDWPRVRRYYKLNGIGWLDGMAAGKDDDAARTREMETLILGSMALRGL
ncbi:kinase binding protein CGI-121-domain-containing protein [Xylariaceae sp. FL0804]|nr:kinase binding protein CGI-121-domain-containing protein [Xylariaceae sp. FL0804]